MIQQNYPCWEEILKVKHKHNYHQLCLIFILKYYITVHPPNSTASFLQRKWPDLRGTI